MDIKYGWMDGWIDGLMSALMEGCITVTNMKAYLVKPPKSVLEYCPF